GKTLIAMETCAQMGFRNVFFVTKKKAISSILEDYHREGYYNKFLLVIKMPSGPMDMSPAVAGVLDPRGCTPRNARMWASRTE
ncbi:MAG: hypothetical protein N3A66_03285, partial [Planctomycetota bacterium]|nr:hypothetical protein [Planctomycetota bacterium]